MVVPKVFKQEMPSAPRDTDISIEETGAKLATDSSQVTVPDGAIVRIAKKGDAPNGHTRVVVVSALGFRRGTELFIPDHTEWILV